jgi:hypothetical protein
MPGINIYVLCVCNAHLVRPASEADLPCPFCDRTLNPVNRVTEAESRVVRKWEAETAWLRWQMLQEQAGGGDD